MKKIFRTAAAAMCLAVALQSWGWSQKGHDVTADIAERHLTPATKAAVDKIFEGKSLVYWANWLDNASHTPAYAYSKTWHYKNVDADKTYETMEKNPNGDVVDAIRYNIGVLADSVKNDAAARALALKMLVHCVGDMHQPMHMGHLSDLGGNRVKIKFFGRDNNLHSVWDGSIVESGHKWSYSEWSDQLDRLDEAQQVVVMSGNIDDWAKQTLQYAAEVYEATPAGTNIGYNEVARWTPLIEQQFVAGGLRLAHILNSIFDPAYSHAKSLAEF